MKKINQKYHQSEQIIILFADSLPNFSYAYLFYIKHILPFSYIIISIARKSINTLITKLGKLKLFSFLL